MHFQLYVIVNHGGLVFSVDGLQVLDRGEGAARRLFVQAQRERAEDDGHGAGRHGSRTHPGLQLEAQRTEQAGRDGDAQQVVEGREGEIPTDPLDRLSRQVQTTNHVQKIVLK